MKGGFEFLYPLALRTVNECWIYGVDSSGLCFCVSAPLSHGVWYVVEPARATLRSEAENAQVIRSVWASSDEDPMHGAVISPHMADSVGLVT